MERHGRATGPISTQIGASRRPAQSSELLAFPWLPLRQDQPDLHEPDHIAQCPVARAMICATAGSTRPPIRLYLFIRDIADGDLVGWIDRLQAPMTRAPRPACPHARSVIGPLRQVYGVSDKVLDHGAVLHPAGAPQRPAPAGIEVGASMIAIDTLVHNFLHPHRHPAPVRRRPCLWAACYRPGGCADIIAPCAAADRCAGVQSGFPGLFPAVRAARDLAVLRPVWPRRLQRQSHR